MKYSSCIISSFYIKPQRMVTPRENAGSCIISSFYIKPQPYVAGLLCAVVVLYLHSTSNHNFWVVLFSIGFVVLYLHSTSNHNS